MNYEELERTGRSLDERQWRTLMRSLMLTGFAPALAEFLRRESQRQTDVARGPNFIGKPAEREFFCGAAYGVDAARQQLSLVLQSTQGDPEPEVVTVVEDPDQEPGG